VYLADKLVDTARATAETRLAEAQRTALKQQSDDARLAARTREAEAAQRTASAARAEAEASRIAADNSRNEAERARGAAEANRLVANAAVSAAASAEDQRQELARQIVILQGTTTERGIVLTLGDVLFATGSDQLKPGAAGNLDRLVAFMGMYGDRSATIEGHTDSVGDERSNEMLSQRRADSVKAYLQGKGVATNRLMSTGKGEAYPISGNDSAGGRQQNRRVEVIIDNPVPTVGSVR
jgi:outer membrane protein OmpA-like peptidoglycan-associated protein